MPTDSAWPADFIVRYPLTLGEVRDFSCGEGWRGLLTDLCDTIEPLIASMPEDERPYAMQVKEKFGSLRFYMVGSVPEIDAAISDAEARSLKTCEACGAPGQLGSKSPHGWVTVRCIACRGTNQTVE